MTKIMVKNSTNRLHKSTLRTHNSWVTAMMSISGSDANTVLIRHNDDTDEIEVELFNFIHSKLVPIVPVNIHKGPVGVHSLLEVCKSCSQITYMIINFKPIMHCVHCSSSIW